MKTIENLQESFENYRTAIKGSYPEKDAAPKHNELLLMWLADEVIDLTFYDDALSYLIGKDLFLTINAILKDKQEYMLKDNILYTRYLICLNLIGVDHLNWGSSIRYCWFEDDETKIYMQKVIDYINHNCKGGLFIND